MKIGIVCYPTHGGSGVIASELAIALAARGHEVHVISYATPFRLRSYHQNIYIHEVTVSTYPLFAYPPYALELAAKLVELVEEYGLEIIHAHYAIPHAASVYLAKQILNSQQIRMITTLHGTDITLVGADPSFRRVVRFVIEQSDGVTAVSKYLEQRTIAEFDIRREIRVIYNFVDMERAKTQPGLLKKDSLAPNGEKIIMHASNFRKVKRVGDVVDVFARILKKLPAKLILIGDGPEHTEIQQQVREMNLTDGVLFLGEQDDLEPLFGCADLFLLPSEQESFGLTALEAMAYGVPVIASDVGGLPEVIIHGETGYLCPVGDTVSMSRSAMTLLNHPSDHDRFSRAAMKRAAEAFNADQIIPQYESYYREIMNGDVT